MNLKLDGKLHPNVVNNIIPNMVKSLSRTNFVQLKAYKLDQYLKKELKEDLTVRNIINVAVSNLQISRGSDGYYNVRINPNIVMPGTPYKVSKLVKFISYGNLEVDGYSLMDDIFNYVSNIQYKINDVFTRKRWR